MRKIDFQNDSYKTGDEPLFFGKPLGLFETLTNPYPELEALNDEQQSLFWPSKEISLAKDAQDIASAPQDEIDLLIENLSFQMAGDSLAAGNISSLFVPILSNNMAVALIDYHNMVESIHSIAYFRIISEGFNNPNVLLDRIRNNEKIFKRLKTISDVFEEHAKMVDGYLHNNLYETDPSYCRRTLLKTCFAVLGLEAIMFLTSFSNTFGLTEATQRFTGVSKLVGLIHDDEGGCHKNNIMTILNILINKEKYPEWSDVKRECKELLDLIVQQECEWADHVFTVCKPLVGFNASLVKDYVYYLSKPIYDTYGLDWNYPEVSKNPFGGWITKYTKIDTVQVAAQEDEISNYLTGLNEDDTDGVEFDF